MKYSLRPFFVSMLALMSFEATAAEVVVKDGRLLVDGKPFFFVSASGICDSLEAMKAQHFNTIFSWGSKKLGPVVQEAVQLDFMVMPFAQCTRVKHETLLSMVQQFGAYDNILAWNIGDDLRGADLERIEEAAKIVREADKRHRPIALDAIHEGWKVGHVPNLHCAYFYPLLKADWPPAVFREFLERGVRKPGHTVELRKDQIRWTWLQVHTQIWYTSLVHGGPPRGHIGSRFPNPEHIRLLLHEALSAGCKGIIYYSYRFFAPDWYGRGRWGEVGLLNRELEIVGPLLADSDPGERLHVGCDDVFARAFRGPFGMLILLTVEKDFYQFHVDEAMISDLRVTLPKDAPEGTAMQLQFPAPRPLERAGRELIVPKVEIASIVLLPSNEELGKTLNERYASLLPDAARCSLEAAKGTHENMQPAFEQLKAATSLADGCETMWQEAARTINTAEAEKDLGECSKSYLATREALRLMRTIQYRCWRKLVGDRNPDWRDWKDMYLLCFYDLPMHARLQQAIDSGKRGENLIANWSFEQMKNDEPVAWSPSSGGPTSTKARCISSDKAYDGKNSYYLTTSQPTIWQGEERDWVTMDATSEKVPVEANSYYEVSGWIFNPADFQKTERGATVGVSRYDAKGELIPGVVEAGEVKATSAWRKVSFFFETRRNIHAVKARIAVCGIGKAYFDCIELRKIPVPAE